MPLESVQSGDDRSAMWKVEKRIARGAAFVQREWVLGLVVVELLIRIQQTIPAVDALFTGFRRVRDLRVVFKAFVVAEALVVAVVADRKDGVVPGAVDTRADANAIRAIGIGTMDSVVDLRVGVFRAGEDAVRIEGCLVAWVRNLELLVQAQVAEMSVDTHVDVAMKAFEYYNSMRRKAGGWTILVRQAGR